MPTPQEDLNVCRNIIDEYDNAILGLLAERRDATLQVASIKETIGAPTLNEARMAEMLATRRTMAAALGLDPDFVEALFRIIHDQSVDDQEVARKQMRTAAAEAIYLTSPDVHEP